MMREMYAVSSPSATYQRQNALSAVSGMCPVAVYRPDIGAVNVVVMGVSEPPGSFQNRLTLRVPVPSRQQSNEVATSLPGVIPLVVGSVPWTGSM
jgi:hypothetical protein